MVNSGSKHAFKYGKKTLTEFSMAVDSKKNSLLERESLIQCYIVKLLSIHYRAECRRLM